VFFNSQVRPPNNGGVFKAIADGANPDPEEVATDFVAWMHRRKNTQPAEAFDALSDDLKTELIKVIDTYLSAIRLQYLLLPHLTEAMRSKNRRRNC